MNREDVRILKALLDTKTEEFSIHHLSILLKKDYKTVRAIVKRLEQEELVRLQPFGKAYKISLVSAIHPLLFEAESARRAETLKNKDLRVMSEYFRKLPSKLFILLLFGSYAKKTQRKGSDIDLMFIVPDQNAKEMEAAVQRTAALIPLPLHILVFTESDFKAMKNSREWTVGQEAIMHNVILYGIEPYYELIR